MILHKNAKKANMIYGHRLLTSFFIVIWVIGLHVELQAQGSAGSAAKMPRMSIVEMPSARILPKGAYKVDGLIMQSSGLVSSFVFGIEKNVNFGISYSLVPFLGEGTPNPQKFPLFEVKARLFSEKGNMPAIAIGVNTQGLGGWTSDDRFRFNAPGAYLVASKNVKWEAGVLTIHAGGSYALMPSPFKKSPIAFAGIEQSFYKNVTVAAEYIGTWNEDPAYCNNSGYLHCAIKYSPFKGVNIQLQLKDLLESRVNADGLLRYAGVEYIGVF